MDYLPEALVRHQLARLGRSQLLDRLHAVRALGAVRGLRFLDDRSRPRTIDLALTPWLLTPAQLAFFQRIVHLMVQALVKLPSLSAQFPAVRQIIPLDANQASWARLASHPRSRPLAVLGRLDSTAIFAHAAWRTRFVMLEPNSVGVGGVHYAPTACSVVLDVLGDVLARALPGRVVTPMPDPRRLLLDELTGVAARLGRRLRRVALIENCDYTTGTDEFAALAGWLTQQGVEGVVVDPRQLRLVRGCLLAKDHEVDLLYRDCELSEFIEMETGGRRLTALRHVIREGRLISGLLWEFDHKSSWELFTDAVWSRHFSPAQQHLFRAHLPWTRLVREARVSDPRGRRVELLSYIRRHKDQLVLKPNTLYGGQGVVVGHTVTRAVWERTLSKALSGSTRYVVQQIAPIATHTFPVLDGDRLHEVTRRVVSGFFFNSAHVGLIGRFSEDPVVNVSRGGGLLSALLVQ